MASDQHGLESIHYRCLRIIVKYFRQRFGREWIDDAAQRLPPLYGGKFAPASLAIKIRQSSQPQRLYEDSFKNTCKITRKPGRHFGYDNSNSLIDRSMTRDWIGQTLGQIQGSWTDTNLSNDQIWRMLKKTFWLIYLILSFHYLTFTFNFNLRILYMHFLSLFFYLLLMIRSVLFKISCM